jgi:acyl carrier protein
MVQSTAIRGRIAAIQETVGSFFVSRLHVEVPSAETDLFETGVLDSLSFVDLLLGLEQAFGVKVTIDELQIEDFRSIGKIAEFVVNRSDATFGC